ncbi:MAG: hypothetical protein AB7E60_14175 [Sphingobium sp.]
MAGRRATFKQADLTRVLRGARAAGMEPRGCRINPVTGEIELQFGNNNPGTGNSFDNLMGGARG